MTQTLTAEKIRSAALARGDVFTPAQDLIAREYWRRRQLASVTFGIELRGISIMLESDWDRIAASIDRRVGTCDPVVDEFFITQFSPMTTKWIHHHPLLDVIGGWFDHYRQIMGTHFDFTRPAYAALTKQPC
jgi:hypothetical protein